MSHILGIRVSYVLGTQYFETPFYSSNVYFYSYAFLAFGHGPRSCIGMRFALVEAKIALARIVKEFVILPSNKTQEPLKDDPTNGISYPEHGLYIKLEKRLQ